MANTKLTRDEKSDLATLKMDNPTINFYTNEETTVAFKANPNCNTVEFSLSVKSPDEVKFRRKVGEYIAIERFLNGHTVKMGKANFYKMLEAFDSFW